MVTATAVVSLDSGDGTPCLSLTTNGAASLLVGSELSNTCKSSVSLLAVWDTWEEKVKREREGEGELDSQCVWCVVCVWCMCGVCGVCGVCVVCECVCSV